MSGVKVVFNEHGKGRVRVAKVRRNANGVQDIIEMTIQVLLQGDVMTDSFTEGNNNNVGCYFLTLGTIHSLLILPVTYINC